ncbi:hypothetical protein [Nostoc sp. 'Peltigera membranacea cyanobiont' 213]|uniref:hypothetical protein n=1 Tax=Nostoc sp. 'Peltigera membranacea cyanobiont' 213 TaxID=2014530 RepID=UPI00167D9437|nr:hypothetical protein [Nostoc sp. 'Peltigera membranacea cyanobiont' 213]
MSVNTQQPTELYSGSQLSEVQEPHPQSPHRLRGGDYDVPHVIRKRYIYLSINVEQLN